MAAPLDLAVAILEATLTASLQAAALWGAAALGMRWFAPRAASARYRVWLALFAGVVALYAVAWGRLAVGLLESASPGAAAVAATESRTPGQPLEEESPGAPELPPATSQPETDAAERVELRVPVSRPAAGAFAALLVALAAAVALARLLRIGGGFARLARMKSALAPISGERERALELWSRERAEGRRATIGLSPAAGTPMVIGPARPAIAIPLALDDALDEREIDLLVLHELAHVRRRDDWALAGQRVVEAVLFFDPVLRLAGRRLEVERELACDEWVVARSGRPRGYAASLLRLAEVTLEARGGALAPGARGRGGELARRIEHLLAARGDRPRAKRALALGHAAAIACGLGCAAIVPAIGFSVAPESALELASDEPSRVAAAPLEETTIGDPEIRRALVDALDGRDGTAIVLDPMTGEVRAIVDEERALRTPMHPASTVKLVTALAALESSRVGLDEPIRARADARPISMERAIALSDNDYFRAIGPRVGRERFASVARELGYGEPTGINLPGEVAGRLPDASELTDSVYSLGDGVEVTPIQLATVVAAFANGGQLLVPRVAGDGTPVVRRDLASLRPVMNRLTPALVDVTRYGTASRAFARSRVEMVVAGKTGTSRDGETGTGIFAAYDVGPRPRYAVVVVLKGKGVMGSDAAKVAARVFAALEGRGSLTAAGR
jgi:beta-lactamase regulating signal transducer with metallopeptidase domain